MPDGSTNLQVSPSSTAAAGPVDVGFANTPSFYSPFAVGKGANATATANDPASSNVMLYAALALGAFVLFAAVIYSRRK